MKMPYIHRFMTLLVVCLLSQNTLAQKSLQDVTPHDTQKKDQKQEKVILFIGDSLTAGYGVKKEEAYPERVGMILKEKGHATKIINGGISGSVSAEADRRLKWYLRAKPRDSLGRRTDGKSRRENRS